VGLDINWGEKVGGSFEKGGGGAGEEAMAEKQRGDYPPPPPFLCGSLHRTHQDRRSVGLVQNGDPRNMQ